MRTRVVLAFLLVAAASTVGLAPAQAGDQRPCVSQREYRDVQETLAGAGIRGWRQARVADHFDLDGSRIFLNRDGTDVDTVWKYRKCSQWGPGGRYVGVWYDNYTWQGDRYMRVYRKTPNRPGQLTEG